MRDERENPATPTVNIARSACAAGASVIDSLNDRRAVDVIATDRDRLKARCADSESRFLAIKKFSWSTASCRIAARQNRLFARIAASDSQLRFLAMHRKPMMNDWCTLAYASSEALARAPASRHVAPTSDAEFGLEQIVDGLRSSLAAG